MGTTADTTTQSVATRLKNDLVQGHRLLQMAGASVGTMLSMMPSVPNVQRIGGFILLGITMASAGVEAALARLN